MSTQTTFDNPSQFETTEITIDDQDVRGLFQSVSIFEDIYRPCVTGNILISDSDGAGFIEEYNIEFIEKIKLKFKNANGDELEFEGVLNGLRNEVVDGANKLYTIDFTSEAVRKNESTFVTNSYKETNPEEIIKDMVKKLGGEVKTNARAKQMNYLGSRKRPVDVIEYVCNHALTQETEATDNGDSQKEEAKGTTGFLCWQTLDEFKFDSVKDILDGKAGESHEDFQTLLANRSASMEESMRGIIQFEFPQIGDFQTKMRSGAFGSKHISFDPDTGVYKEYDFYNKENMTEKQKKALPEGAITRIYNRLNSNQKFNNECQMAKPLTGDQSRGYVAQSSGGQNTFNDQSGHFTLYPQFKFRAGDVFDCKISKVEDEEKAQGGFDKKHSGKYIIQAVGHHFFVEGKAYTRIKTIRSTIEQNEESAAKTKSQKDWAKGQLGRPS